jgi:prephenate dehydrogenase
LPPPNRIVLVGVGLMGGSLGLALRKRGGARVVGLARREETLREARRRGVLHEGFTDPARALDGASVVVFCAPVDKIVPLVRASRRFLSSGKALLMDVGSVKGPLVRALDPLFLGENGPVFVGAHPMAGSEKTGVQNARADLYKNAVCAITPTAQTPGPRVIQAVKFWKSVGARPVLVDAETHDRAVALVSHLPHLIADALILSAGRENGGAGGVALLKELAAGSFRDATRVSGADPALWHEIFRMNDRAVRAALRLFSKEINRLARGRWPLADLRRAQTLNVAFRSQEKA